MWSYCAYQPQCVNVISKTGMQTKELCSRSLCRSEGRNNGGLSSKSSITHVLGYHNREVGGCSEGGCMQEAKGRLSDHCKAIVVHVLLSPSIHSLGPKARHGLLFFVRVCGHVWSVSSSGARPQAADRRVQAWSIRLLL